MTVAFDAVTNSGLKIATTGNFSWTHTPVGTPKGIIVYIIQEQDVTDTVTGVTYGGVAMSEVSGSPKVFDSTGTDSVVYAYFLGSGIPSGNQTVSVTHSPTSFDTYAVAISITASGDTGIIDVEATIGSVSNNSPSCTLSLGGNTCFCSIGFFSGMPSAAGITPLSGWTNRLEGDMGPTMAGCYTYDTIGSTDVTAGWSQSNEDANAIAIAVAEIAVATAYTFTGPASGMVNVASTNFTVTPNGTSTAEVTPASDGSGSFTPSSVTFDGTAAAKTFTYTPTDTAGSPHTLSVTNDGGLTDPDDLEYTVNAAGGSLPPRRRNQIRKFLQRG